MLFYLILLLPVLLVIYKLLFKKEKSEKDFWSEKGFPVLKPRITVWEILSGQKESDDADLDYYTEMKRKGLKFAWLEELGANVLIVNDLDLAKEIYVRNFDSFTDRRDFAKTKDVVCESLVFLQGQKWKNVRSAMTPCFTSNRIRGMFPHFQKAAENLKTYVKKKNGPVNLSDVLRRFTVQVIGTAGFGMNVNLFEEEDSELLRMAESVGSSGFLKKIRMAVIFMLPKLAGFLNLGILDKEPSTFFSGVLTAAIKLREENASAANKPKDFLQLIVDTKLKKLNAEEIEYNDDGLAKLDSKDLKWTDDLVLGQALLFLLAGFEDVANTLSNCVAVLSRHPEVQDRLRKELTSSSFSSSYEDTTSLEYMEMFISEVLRLYPAAIRIERKCVKEFGIPGTDLTIPKDVIIAFIVEGIHRDEDHFKDSLTFQPQRFSKEEKAERHPYAFQAFGVGPRSCIGMRFALMEIKACLAQILLNFKIQPLSPDSSKDIKRVMLGYRANPELEIEFVPF